MKLDRLIGLVIVAIVYTILLKLSHILVPGLYEEPVIAGFARVLSLVAAIVVVLFLVAFHRAERSNRSLAPVLRVLMAGIALRAVLRLLGGHEVAHLVVQGLAVVNASLLLAAIVLYGRSVPAAETALRWAAALVTVMLAIGVVASVAQLVYAVRFVGTGEETRFGPGLYAAMLVVFLATQGAIIHFLWRYRRAR